MAWRKGLRGGGPTGPGLARPATHASQTPLRLARERPSSLCNAAAAPVCKLQTPPKPAPACKGRDAAEKWGAKQFWTERPWEGGRDWRSKACISPHSWIPSLLTPPPLRPRLCSCKGGKTRRIRMQTWGVPPRSYCSGTARDRATRAPPPRNSARRVGTGPRPLPKQGLCVCKGGSWHLRHAPFNPPPLKTEFSLIARSGVFDLLSLGRDLGPLVGKISDVSGVWLYV